MPDPRQRFIDLALRPLAGKPAAEVARGELMERLNHVPPGVNDGETAAAVARLEAVAPCTIGPWIAGGLAVFLGVLGTVAFGAWREMERLGEFYDLPHPGSVNHGVERSLSAGRTPEERRFLYANSETLAYEVRREWLDACKSSLPDDPAELEEFADAGGLVWSSVRERLLNRARRIDPGNGMWDLRDAMAAAKNTSRFRFSNRSPGWKAYGPVIPHLTTDDRYHHAVAMLEKAALAPRLESRLPARNAERLESLGKARDLAGLADRRVFAEDQRIFVATDSSIQTLTNARAHELEMAGDLEGLRRWHGTLEALRSRGLAAGESGGTTGFHQLPSMDKEFKQLLERRGLSEEAARMDRRSIEAQKVHAGFGGHPGWEDYRVKVAAFDTGDWLHTTFLFVPEADLIPGRRAEHAMADRLLAVAAAILFGVLAILAGLEGWRRSRPVRGLADGLFPLLRPVDFAWLAGLGIALPAAWHVAVSLSPVGGREFTVTAWDMLPAGMRAGGSFLFAACLLVQTARWRLARRAAVIGFHPALWPGWVLAAVAALFVPAMGAVRYLTKHEDEFLEFGSAVAGLPLLWLLWRSFALILCPRAAAVPGVIVCRMLVPAFLLAGSVLLAVTPLLKRQEEFWIARDTLAHPDPAGSGMSVADARVWELYREQLRQAIAPHFPARQAAPALPDPASP